MNIIDIIDQLKHSQIFKYLPDRARLTIEGPDAKDFLQRMSTNDMSKLSPKHAIQTCLLNNKGKIIDCVVVVELSADFYLLVSSHDDQRLYNWLSSYIFVEDLTLKEASNPIAFLLSSSEIKSEIIRDKNFLIWSSQDINIYISLTSPDYPIINNEIWQCLRIAALMPAALQEINDNYMPQNIGLADLVADNKGCYVGQEVIAKALTYQKNVKSLAGCKLSAQDFSRVRLQDRLSYQGCTGLISSIAPAYSPNIANALVVLDHKALEAEKIACEFILTKSE